MGFDLKSINFKAIAEGAVSLVEKLTPWGQAAAPLIETAKSLFSEVSGGLAEQELAPLQARIDSADAERERTWKEADSALDAASER